MAQGSAKGRPYRRLVAWGRANLPPVCWRCWKPIDLGLPPRHPMAWSWDHRQPLARGGSRLDPANGQPMHYGCNASKGSRVDVVQLPKPSRDW